jgi:hypothetical protein
MVEGTYPSLSHIVMTWRSSASDACARTSRIMLVYTSLGTEWMFRQYEKLRRDVRRSRGASDYADQASLRGNLILAAARAPELPPGNCDILHYSG